MKAGGIAHGGVARRQVGMHGERRLHIGECRNDDPPDAFDGVERQNAAVAIDQPAHHLGLARGPEGGTRLLGLLHRDQTIDDLAALHQKAVHRLIDAIDLLPQIRKRRSVRNGTISAMMRHEKGRKSAPLIRGGARESKENIDSGVPRTI